MAFKIGFIGLGNMGEALIKAFEELDDVESLIGIDAVEERNDEISSRYNIRIADSIKTLEIASDIILLAVKPKDFDSLLPEIKDTEKLVISISAGVQIDKIESQLPNPKLQYF